MGRPDLDLLFVSQWTPSPASIGAQRRVEGLMKALSQRHRVSCVALLNGEHDRATAERATRAYCHELVLVPPRKEPLLTKRLLQLRVLASSRSYEHYLAAWAPLRRALESMVLHRRYDAVVVEDPYLMQLGVRGAPPGERPPRVVLDEHNIWYVLAQRSQDASGGLFRRTYHTKNWPRIMREEMSAWREADGVAFTSADDADRARALSPGLTSAIVPNAVDVEHFHPRAEFPASDGKTLVFFGTLDYFPNQDAMQYFLKDIWPRIAQGNPRAKLRVVGPRPTPEVLAYRGPRVEVTGLVPDPRPHLAAAACIIAPLRVGGGTRFKILEAMAMGRPVVSTTVGAEGIGARPEEEILIADEPGTFASAVLRILDAPELATRLGQAGRALVEERFSWATAAENLERFLGELLGAGEAGRRAS